MKNNKTISIITKDNNENLINISDISILLIHFELLTKNDIKDIIIDDTQKSILNIFNNYKFDRKSVQHRSLLTKKYNKIITNLLK